MTPATYTNIEFQDTAGDWHTGRLVRDAYVLDFDGKTKHFLIRLDCGGELVWVRQNLLKARKETQ